MKIKDAEYQPVNRNREASEVLNGLPIDPVRLSAYLSALIGETPRIGDLGGGTGKTSRFLNEIGIETFNVDPGLVSDDEKHHVCGKFGDVHFPHKPQLIIAHQSIVALPDGHRLKGQYADFNAIAQTVVEDADERVGTIVMDASWPIETPIKAGLQTLKDGGFHLIRPKSEPGKGDRMSMVFSRVKELGLEKF